MFSIFKLAPFKRCNGVGKKCRLCHLANIWPRSFVESRQYRFVVILPLGNWWLFHQFDNAIKSKEPNPNLLIGSVKFQDLIGYPDKKNLQKIISSKAWSKFIRWCSYVGEGLMHDDDVRDLVRVIHFMELEEWSTFLLLLLDWFVSGPQASWVPRWRWFAQAVTHTQTPSQMRLKEVEGFFKIAEQSYKSTSIFFSKKPLLSTLSLSLQGVLSKEDADLNSVLQCIL